MVSKVLKLVSGSFELLLGFPILGGMFILATGWTPLWFMFFFHLVTLIICAKEGTRYYGSVLGLAASALGWIPFLGMGLHILSGIVLVADGLMTKDSRSRRVYHRR
ncbi:hypothetical protein CGZ90_05115 [Fictibacillus aquaticus]|uniref:Uncharacterized protein n=1 Tax=Fictibacillus aquaticus TaxID=2021314 RepID=A0A235FES7_9BACL|nr:hypothetical protein CGZ90_05115 [Fictibacillus aquaticus]